MKARRFETLHDTTLWKVHKPTRLLQTTDADPDVDSPENQTMRRMLQIDIQRWIRSMIRYLKENAPAESPCNYGEGLFIVKDFASVKSTNLPLPHPRNLT